MIGWPNPQHIQARGWRASIVTAQPDPPKIIQHTESFEVTKDGLREML